MVTLTMMTRSLGDRSESVKAIIATKQSLAKIMKLRCA